MFYCSDILRPTGNPVVVLGTLQRLLETGVILCRHQETQTEIGEPGGDELYHGMLNWIPSASSLVLAKSRAL